MPSTIDATSRAPDGEAIVFSRKSSGLVKSLDWWDVFILVISAPAGSGILYYSVSTASQYPGGNVAVSFAIGMLLVFPVVFIAAVTSAIVPRSGSLYVLISRVLGPALGYIAAVLFYVGYTLSVGVVAFVVVQVLGGILVNAALVADLDGLNAIGTRLSRPAYSALGGAVLVVLTWALVLAGVRAFRRTMRVLFLVTVVAALFTVVYFFAVPSLGGSAALFDRVWGPNTYAGVLNAAREAGWAFPGFSWGATFGLLLVVLFSYGGLELISYASGEVSQARERPLVGYLAGWVALALVYMLLASSVVVAFGDFLGAYDYVVRNSPERLEGVMPAISPSVPFYIASVVPNPWVALAVSVGLLLWFVTTMVPYFFAPSRLIFALAMDRAIPLRFADVSERTGAPTTASHLTLAIALAGVLLNLLNVAVVLGTILFCALFVYWLYGLSAMLLPYRRRDLYAASPVQANFASIPVLSWVGLAAFGVGWFVIFVAVRALTIGMSVALTALMVVALGLYLLMLRKNRQAGVETDRIYEQIPPD